MSVKILLSKARKYLSVARIYKKYGKFAMQQKVFIDRNYSQCDSGMGDTIFVCWLQGMDNAPELVKICYKSLIEHNSSKEIAVITDDNYMDYVKFPQFILDKYNNGCISKTHFSDLLRLELLIKYGGIWVDSTAFFTAPIPDIISNSGLFVFQSFQEHSGMTTGISNWFIASSRGNKMLLLERELLYEYWRHNNKLNDYFIFHNFFVECVIRVYNDEWNSVIKCDNSAPKILDCYLFDDYNKDLYDFIASKSFIHKFMYKYSQDKFDRIGTFYDILRKRYI